MPQITQTSLPITPWATPATARLPGIQPIVQGDWLRVDDAYSGQIARREELLATRPNDVLRMPPGSAGAALELLQEVLRSLSAIPGFTVTPDSVTCPDGRIVVPETHRPLVTLASLVQEDFCLLEKRGEEHVLGAALLCFPASWRLDEKIGRPLSTIHDPVDEYDQSIGHRVQRLFNAVRVEQPLWRANALLYDDPELFQPRSSNARRDIPQGEAPWLRSERQVISRLPKSDWIVFSIHTYVVSFDDLTAEQLRSLENHKLGRVAR